MTYHPEIAASLIETLQLVESEKGKRVSHGDPGWLARKHKAPLQTMIKRVRDRAIKSDKMKRSKKCKNIIVRKFSDR